ncbi:MAG: hypothetical protein ACREQK_18790 [Candidatus Binatia bacterium]
MSNLLTRLNPSSYRKALIFGAWGAAGGAIGGLVYIYPLSKIGIGRIPPVAEWMWLFAAFGLFTVVAIIVGYSSYLKRPFQSAELLKASVFGLIAGAVAGALAAFVMISTNVTHDLMRPLCWGIAGGVLGLGLSYRIQNLGMSRGLIGGAIGGLCGGTLVQFLSGGIENILVFIFGSAAVGFFIGLMLVIAETMLREAWLDVSYGPKETRSVSLGAEPVSIGGDVGACTVYARNAPPVAFRYRLDQGRVTCEDVTKGSVATVQPGSSRVIGNLTVTVRAPGVAAQAAPVQAAARPAGGFSLRLPNGKTIPLADGAKISATDIPGLQPSSGGAVAEVGRNPNDPSVLGLKNLSRAGWTVTLANRDRMQVDPGRSVKLQIGTRISFGPVEGEIH